MTEEELKVFLFKDPEGFFEYCDDKEVSLDFLKELDVPRLLVRKKYKKSFDEEYFRAADAVLWIAYYCERWLTETIEKIEVKNGVDREQIRAKLDAMVFGQKISFTEENYNVTGSSDAYINILRTIKGLRNSMAHGRMEELKYNGYSLAEVKGQMFLMVDLTNATLVR